MSGSMMPPPALSSGQNSSQAMMTGEETQGQALWEKFRDKKITCPDFKTADYELIGEFLMGQMMGSMHDVMNQHLKDTLGASPEEAMHVTMAKRLTGCDPNAAWPPQATTGDRGVMNMVMGGWMPKPAPQDQALSRVAQYLGAFVAIGILYAILKIVLWIFAIWGIISFVKWLIDLRKGKGA